MNETELPVGVLRVVRTLGPDDPAAFQPNNLAEWATFRRTETVLATWASQVEHERALRNRVTIWVFSLIAFQLIGLLGLLFLNSFESANISVELLKVVVVSICAEVVGLGFVVVKYLFSSPLRLNLDSMMNLRALVDGGDEGKKATRAPSEKAVETDERHPKPANMNPARDV